MKVIVTGSLGNIGKPLAKELVEKGHTVTVISSKPEKQKDIEALGATAAIGSLSDVDFLVSTFTGVDAVFAMVPPDFTEPDQVSVGKIERGLTTKLSSHSKSGLANALQVPGEYLEAVCRGTPIVAVSQLKFCTLCWTPGTPPDPLWMEVRAKYCFLCSHCHEMIASLKHRFCPFCGTAYKSNLDFKS